MKFAGLQRRFRANNSGRAHILFFTYKAGYEVHLADRKVRLAFSLLRFRRDQRLHRKLHDGPAKCLFSLAPINCCG